MAGAQLVFLLTGHQLSLVGTRETTHLPNLVAFSGRSRTENYSVPCVFSFCLLLSSFKFLVVVYDQRLMFVGQRTKN
jgi:hypothetical protein